MAGCGNCSTPRFPALTALRPISTVPKPRTAYGRAMPFVVIDKASGRLVGATRYMRMKPEAKRLEIGTTFYAQSVQRTSGQQRSQIVAADPCL